MKPPILVLHVSGTNRDREATWACEIAGGAPEIVHVQQLRSGARRLSDYRMLVLPGGFSFGDDLGAGKLWALTLRHALGADLDEFVASGRPVLGICNGFQALIKAGLLPGGRLQGEDLRAQSVSLVRNQSNRFECRWVHLRANPTSPCVFTRNLGERAQGSSGVAITCPVAHGEGRLVTRDASALEALRSGGHVALRYANPDGARVGYPWNPNGSDDDIAGICNRAGNVLGLMPHPEDHIQALQHPAAHSTSARPGGLGLVLFENGVKHAQET